MQLLKDIVSFIFKLLLNLGVPAFLLWLLYKALMALALTNPWTATLIAAVLLLLWLAAAMEAGVPMVTPGCALIQYRWVRRDVCTTTTCSRACVAVKGPWPSVLGPFALFSQDIGCFCAPNAPPGFGDFFQAAFDGANTTARVAALYNRLLGLLINEPESPRAQRLRDLIEKVNRGDPLSDDDQAFVDEIFAEN